MGITEKLIFRDIRDTIKDNILGRDFLSNKGIPYLNEVERGSVTMKLKEKIESFQLHGLLKPRQIFMPISKCEALNRI